MHFFFNNLGRIWKGKEGWGGMYKKKKKKTERERKVQKKTIPPPRGANMCGVAKMGNFFLETAYPRCIYL